MKKIVVFGAGDNMFQSYRYLKGHYDIVAFIDNNEKKQGMEFSGCPVISVSEIGGIEYDSVLITPTLHQPIYHQLLEHGVNSEKIMFLGEILNCSQYKANASVAFCVQGGLTDCLAAANYIWHFAKKILPPSCAVDVYCSTESEDAHFIFDRSDLIRGVFFSPLDNYKLTDYDLIIQLNPYPIVLYRNDYFLSRLLPKTIDYILTCERFKISYGQLLMRIHHNENRAIVFEEIKGRNWLKALDIYGYMGMPDEFKFRLTVSEQSITQFSDGRQPLVLLCTLPGGDVRDWQPEYWDIVRKWLVKTYEDQWIVDVIDEDFDGYMVDWLKNDEKVRQHYTLEKMAVLLRDSRLAVGVDNPLIHLRYALHGGKSIVLFGATSEKVWGCPGNENIRGMGCKHWCEGVTDNWEKRCLRKITPSPCMSSISSEWITERIKANLTVAGI